MEKEILSLNQYQIEVCINGDSPLPPIVFLHGMGASLSMWEEQISYFSENFKTISLSLQGHGKSSAPKGKEHYTVAAYADTVCDLLRLQNISSCILIGNSMGGVIGYEVRRRHPEKIPMLITHGTTPRLSYSSFATNAIVFMDYILLRTMGPQKMFRLLSSQVTPYPSVQEKVYQTMKDAFPKMIPITHRALSNYDYLPSLLEQKNPVCILQGELDKGINESIQKVKPFLSDVNHVSFFSFPNAGHMLNMELPQEYNQLVEKQILKIL